MQTSLNETIRDTPLGREADAILRSCVHCGFCNATCPTYQLLGDELDGPRGRIYLIKEMLETGHAGAATQTHLDRCLTCLSCETTCPSGVKYGRLLDIGRTRLDRKVKRSRSERWLRRLLRLVAPYPKRIRTLLPLARRMGSLLPESLVNALPPRPQTAEQPPPAPRHARRVLLLGGCVQAATHPGINGAAARILDRLGISVQPVAGEACCGALSQHLAAEHEAREFMLRNINTWWPHLDGVEAIISTSSACSLMLKQYATLLGEDPEYGHKARRVATLSQDISEFLAGQDLTALRSLPDTVAAAFHAPCTLQHGLGQSGTVEGILSECGYRLTAVADAHLCCGAAGTYSVLQPELSDQLRREKVTRLESGQPEVIATANIGCLLHLQGQSQIPVRHWLELLDDNSPAPAAR